MTRYYDLPCPHPTRDIVAGTFRLRNIARLCDQCLILLHEERCGDVPPHALEREEFKLDVSRARAMASVFGVVHPDARDLELLPVAAALVARCDDLLTVHMIVRPPWALGDVFIERGTTGDLETDKILMRAHVDSSDDAHDLDAMVDRVTEEASS